MVDCVLKLKNDRLLHAFLARGALMLVNALFSKKTVFTRFQWALVSAYPELENHFIAVDALEEKNYETSGCGARVSLGDQ
jgi:hypothetical protein